MGSQHLYVLVDNEALEGFESAWGISFLVELPGARVLFDTGPEPGVLCRNASRLGVELSGVDAVVISHPHRDHYGGLPCVARFSPGVQVVLPPSPSGLVAWVRRLGLAPTPVRGSYSVAPGATASPALEAGIGLWERGLAVESPRGPVVLLGCSHPGGDRLVEEALRVLGASKAWLVAGGLHDPPRGVVERLLGLTELLAPMHCSGWARGWVAEHYPDRFLGLAAGSVVELG